MLSRHLLLAIAAVVLAVIGSVAWSDWAAADHVVCFLGAAGLFSVVFHVVGRRSETRTGELRKLSLAVEQSPSVVMITDAAGAIEYVNPRFEEVTGYTAAEVHGRNPRILKSGYMPADYHRNLWRTLQEGRDWHGELYNRKKNGDLFWEHATISPIKAADGSVTHFVAVKEDIIIRKEYEKRLLHQAHFDDLTGLPNRMLAVDRLTQAQALAKQGGRGVALMFIDLDDFKKVNETLGHAVGDRLLRTAASRIRSVARDGDTVARLGGDEFMVVLPDLIDTVRAELVAEQVLEACAAPYRIDGDDLFVTASVGITVSPADDEDPLVLMRNAEAAMYRAKGAGRDTFRFFTPQMNVLANERLRMENGLRRALERDELAVHYQPLIDNASGRVIAAEALVRWRPGDLGPVSPSRFIPLAEDTGLIDSIGEWVLATACRDATTWHGGGGKPITLAVNISSRQFHGCDLVQTVFRALEQSGLDAKRLELEITENALLDDSEETARAINCLSDHGVNFAIDDFGTGYSSLGYLKRYPFNTLKVDRMFVRDVTRDADSEALVRSIIAMARIMDMRVVGEGVETREQFEALQSAGCTVSQGWYFSHALPPDQFSRFIADAGAPVREKVSL